MVTHNPIRAAWQALPEVPTVAPHQGPHLVLTWRLLHVQTHALQLCCPKEATQSKLCIPSRLPSVGLVLQSGPFGELEACALIWSPQKAPSLKLAAGTQQTQPFCIYRFYFMVFDGHIQELVTKHHAALSCFPLPCYGARLPPHKKPSKALRSLHGGRGGRSDDAV